MKWYFEFSFIISYILKLMIFQSFHKILIHFFSLSLPFNTTFSIQIHCNLVDGSRLEQHSEDTEAFR